MSKLVVTDSTVKKPCYYLDKNTIRLSVYILPNASCDEVIGKHGDSIKIRLTARPIAGAANKQLIKYLAKCFQVKKNQIKISKGQTSRVKLLEIRNASYIPDNFCYN